MTHPGRRWREPPILFQILILLVGGLIVAQLVTLFLTLILPPPPPPQHDMAGIVAALRGGQTGDRLTRSVQAEAPDVAGKGWFTSATSRHALAVRLGVADDAVRLAFYAPVPFAGITAPPSAPPSPLRPVAWQAAQEPLGVRTAGIRPIALLLDGQPGPPPGAGFPDGGFSGGGFPPGGFPSGGFPGGGFPGRDGARFPDRGDGPRDRSGTPPGRAIDGGRSMPRNGVPSGRSPSPADLDRQPIAPLRSEIPDGGFDRGLDSRPYAPLPNVPQDASPSATPVDASPPRPSTETPRTTPIKSPAAELSGRPEPTAAERPAPVRMERARGDATGGAATPVPIRSPSRALFGLAPAPFVEGDFVAAWHRPDGRWTVVQPEPEPFPNNWQRRVMLWFAIAFGIVTPFGWLFARHIARPLARFTDVAERLGRDPSAGPVALMGPAEIGRAAHAFNIMQSRLRSFVDDRTAMVGAISHDLRTPLTRLRFRIEDVDDEAVRNGMIDEVDEMEAMIASVLDFIRDASTSNARERIDLGMLLEDVAQDAAFVGHEVVLEPYGPAVVEIDPLGIRRLVSNLVENAVKYGARARLRLDVDGEDAVARIVDDGPGVPDGEIERVFEPFYRTSDARRSGKTGSGLGLAVCRSIARAHGGDVRLLRSTDGFVAEMRVPLVHRTSRLAA